VNLAVTGLQDPLRSGEKTGNKEIKERRKESERDELEGLELRIFSTYRHQWLIY